jgi:hypothetical protein
MPVPPIPNSHDSSSLLGDGYPQEIKSVYQNLDLPGEQVGKAVMKVGVSFRAGRRRFRRDGGIADKLATYGSATEWLNPSQARSKRPGLRWQQFQLID